MCGRYSLYADYRVLLERFNIDEASFSEEDYSQSFNVAPSQQVVAVVSDGKKNRLGFLKWGLVPPWAKDEKIGYKMINARAETAAEKPSFRNAFKKKRCLVVADSFYEWKRRDDGKTPMRIKLKSGEPFAFAALWESWKSPEGKTVNTCSILTTGANELMGTIHDRMPVILTKEAEKIWLDPNVQDAEELGKLLQPFDSNELEAYEVSDAVNSPKNNGPELIEKIG
ncbi:SOS response-associated peptidase [Planococcus liqunii]|uniref:Abasic site processing protein n=1 Tax=Planococcus liqunii TaxID=3058394 RepID=A0ABT8MRP6_9BACL|nr:MULTISPECIES: SOS response-associated peptidase [unclassified Planococcus (in: firmicutes)]MDN7227587.1 SOS response-associated peptidase [Planococcus sp. N064]WKA50470.1 SOS response-associated peptidase [Planococcus sp. N056]